MGLALVERFRRRDAEEEAWYTCFGGPGEPRTAVWRSVGAQPIYPPAGFDPAGSVVAMQVHYNTLTDEPESDRTQIGSVWMTPSRSRRCGSRGPTG